jgi:two-component system, LytTR family, response regulator
MRVLVVDDEAPARARLRRLLADVPGVTIVGEAADGEDGVARIAALTPDVVLLDVRMPRLDGFGVVAAMGAEMPLTVFCTAFDEHALRAFEARAVDYLLKPVRPERLAAALARARTLLDGAAAPRARRQRAITELVESRGERLARVLVHDARRAYLLPVERIDHIRAERNYCTVRAEGRSFRVRRTLASLAARLDPQQFLRVNKSDVVRLDAVHEIQPWSHGDYRMVLRDGTTLSWSRRYRAAAGEA